MKDLEKSVREAEDAANDKEVELSEAISRIRKYEKGRGKCDRKNGINGGRFEASGLRTR